MLRAHAERLAYGVHVLANVEAVNVSRARRRRVESGENGPGDKPANMLIPELPHMIS